MRQGVNGADVLLSRRLTDTAPTGNFLRLQDAAGADLVSIDIAGNLTVKNATFNGTLTVNGHIITGSAAPTAVTAGAGAGTGGSCTITGNDTSGTVTVVTGTTPAAGVLCTATVAFSTAPRPVISGSDQASAALAPFMSATTTTFTIGVNGIPANPGTYRFNYFNAQ